ncbi:hypothetical protein SteCoe_24991 [Stentor coeruleus]|uniref:Tyrosine-protein kinase ephrin type A/B receptor-like domain-containing protein n=1 Tax=Stentor coeruleus TaxID=5963 RepID=A0A1R2BGD7_9CILI|nr:hypothetical protein SteCoe_24991 [Stentor coeruleus]
MLNTTYVRVGGQFSYIYISQNALVFDGNGGYCVVSDTYSYVYFSSYAYYKDQIFSFGGGFNQGSNPIFSIGTYNFYTIDMKEICSSCNCTALCSKGTYTKDNQCIECERGHYSEIMGSTSCTPCPPGTFNSNYGSSSYRQCYPCPEGTFTSKYGSAKCNDCPSNVDCPAGSKKPSKVHYAQEYYSLQPKMYSPGNNDFSFYFIIAVANFSILVIIFVLSINKIRTKLRFLDIFSDMHNHSYESPMVMTKNNFGGFFAIVFAAVTIIFVGSSVIDYTYNNIQETKALVPLIVLEDYNTQISSDKLIVESTLVGYGGECGVNGKCNENILIDYANLKGTYFYYKCAFVENSVCVITIIFHNFEILGKASIFINSKEKLSYTSAIFINVTTNSSIPNEISSIKNELYASKNYVFYGMDSSEFYYTITPSLFVSESSKWPSRSMGFHISSEELPLKGTQCLEVDLPISAEVKVLINLYKSNSGLYTQRLLKQSIFILASGILGSVFGIMSAIASLMNFLEDKYLNIAKIRDKKIDFYAIASKRQIIKSSYFGIRKNSSKSAKNKLKNRVLPLNDDESTFFNK